MIHDLVEAAEAYLNSFVYQMPLDPSIPSESRFIASVNPVQMGANLPLVIHSEGDSHAWICSVIVRPVCQLLRLDPLSDVAPALIGPSAEGPDCRTNCGGAPHPDGCFWSNGRIFMTLESKSPAILPYSDDGENTYPFKDLVTYLEKVWGHMSAKDVDYAVLSSYASTTFFVRQDGYLYMSEPEELTANYLLSWFGFAAIASGKISKRSILLETPDEDDTLDAGLLGLSLGSD
ncbi:hypothetical protein PUNSTDRAFT_134826 [Punctularia strigosozonata HHB-11173 SS5]|uniref:uncharacterized protein n=1 Tax=Punctularia strigosozonata (strain HHB-11173) TaxID=741275 RepID=UPI0004417061|nr:uncharacterized protein PUNSTDRAFT_134826 [Punctularia strigosozonata HHB-11173 SS5]EIN08445.1 hypothetical protein PUNSTDRAFT_134826 [Punctularia strigosozonata HHB-11173 SS5]